MGPHRCLLCDAPGGACGRRRGIPREALDLPMTLINTQGAGMTSPVNNNNSETPEALAEYTYTVSGVDYTAQLSKADAEKLGAKPSGGTVELAKPWQEKKPVEETTPGYGRKETAHRKSEDAPANKAQRAPANK